MDSKCWWNKDFEARSRNWEDEEIDVNDEIEGQSVNDVIFTWSIDLRKSLGNEKLRSDCLLIACGPCASIFLDLQYQDKVLIGSLTLPLVSQSQNSLRFNSNNNSCQIFRASPTIVLVLCLYTEDNVDTEGLFWWTSELFRHIEAKSVLVLDYIADRKVALTENVDPGTLSLPQLRYLATHIECTSIPKLEPPLLVNHFAASILSYCQTFKIASVLFLSLSNNNYFGGETLKGFELASGSVGINFQELSAGIYERELENYKGRSKNPLYT